MDLWQMKIFVAIVETKSFSKASELLNLSQPTVSSHIKDLENHFECRLLDRLGKYTEPTKAGQILYQYAKRLLELKEVTETAMSDFLGEAKGNLVIGGSTIPSTYILPGIIGAFSGEFPGIRIELITGDTSKIIKEIKKGNIEAGFVGAQTDDALIVQEKFVHDEMQLIIPSDHPWANQEFVSCAELSEQAFIAREKGSGTWQSILKSMKKAGFDSDKLNTPIIMGNTISVIQSILHGAGISILSTIAVQDHIEKGRLKALIVRELNLERFFYLTTSARRTLSPICKKFIDFANDTPIKHIKSNIQPVR
ncbi:MAG: LysR family transcriptional regulator [Desulfobacula sp.]|nr:LysR family transcriptional regulator [Desulfobacula sp.]